MAWSGRRRPRAAFATPLGSVMGLSDIVAMMAVSMVAKWSMQQHACAGICLILKLPGQLNFVGGIGIGGMAGREGFIGKFLNAPVIPWATLNGIRTVTGVGMIIGSTDHLGARRAGCGLLLLAHCLGFSGREPLFLNVELAPHPTR